MNILLQLCLFCLEQWFSTGGHMVAEIATLKLIDSWVFEGEKVK